VQGLTEFLPVSSSGHLVLLQHFFGFNEPELLFDVSLHCGTLLAILVVFYREIMSLIRTILKLPFLIKQSSGFKNIYMEDENVRMMVFILVGSIPTGILGLVFKSMVDQLFGTAVIASTMLLVTGTLLWCTRYVSLTGRNVKKMTFSDALIVGTVQGLAILPGISRSGSTISVALFKGLDREVAGRYSFLLSIPAIVGALVLSLESSIANTSLTTSVILLGTFVAGLTGYISLLFLLKIVKNGKLYWFSPYCWAAGSLSLIHWM
jgi:undecaprenyl-diphosphatase